MSYYEQPKFYPVILATYSEGNKTAELTVLDEDGEYFSADVFITDSEGYQKWLNNSGSVSREEALEQFKLDLDCFFLVEYTEDMNTESFNKWA